MASVGTTLTPVVTAAMAQGIHILQPGMPRLGGDTTTTHTSLPPTLTSSISIRNQIPPSLKAVPEHIAMMPSMGK